VKYHGRCGLVFHVVELRPESGEIESLRCLMSLRFKDIADESEVFQDLNHTEEVVLWTKS
jgi:hypothetical protein